MNEEEKKSIEEEVKKTPEEEEKEKKIFWARFTAFILVGFIAPIIYLIVRYNLFKPTSGIAIGVWGIIVIGIMIALVGVLIWYYLESMKFKYHILKQIIAGIVKIELPLLLAILLFTYFKNNIDMVIESLWVIFGTTMLAIPINPLPKYCFEHNIEGMGEVAKKVYDKVTKENSSKKDEKEHKE